MDYQLLSTSRRWNVARTDPSIVGEWIEEVKLARKAVCSELNLAVVYHDDGRMQVTAGPDACTNECVGGGT